MELLATVRVETQDLQEQKERLQVTFAQLKKTVDETKTAVNFNFCFLNATFAYNILFVVKSSRSRTEFVSE